MDSIQLKIEFENSLRRASVNRTETSLAKLKQTLCALVGVTDCDIKYRDEENDLITIGSDLELHDLLQQVQANGGAGPTKILRLIVVSSAAPASPSSVPMATVEPAAPAEPARAPPQAAAPVQEEPEIPWVNLARALAQPEIVTRVQQVLQSPVLTEAVNRAAQGYVDSKGDIVISALMASQQLPSLMGVLAELLEELPVLGDLQTLVVRGFQEGLATSFSCARREGPHPGPHCGPHGGHHPGPHGGPHPGPHCGPHGGPHHHGPHGGPHHHGPHPGPHCGPHHHGPNHVNKHFGVFCDGCGSDAELKKASVQAGHQTRRGFIRGLRYKSQSVHDFDLCESCKASDRFPDRAYGPFVEVQPQQGPFGGGRGCGRANNPWFAAAQASGDNSNWRDGRSCGAPAGQQPPAAEATDKKTEEPQQHQFDFMEAIRSAMSRGTEAFVEATKNEKNDFGDIARAIAESLKETTTSSKPVVKKEDEEVKPTTTAAAPPSTEDWVPVATPATPPKENTSEDPFIKWSTQLGQLEALGFDRTETYITFLEEEKGDLDRVVSRIVSRDL
jgi:hypothetical protein